MAIVKIFDLSAHIPTNFVSLGTSYLKHIFYYKNPNGEIKTLFSSITDGYICSTSYIASNVPIVEGYVITNTTNRNLPNIVDIQKNFPDTGKIILGFKVFIANDIKNQNVFKYRLNDINNDYFIKQDFIKDQWYYYEVIIDKTNKNIKIYINNNLTNEINYETLEKFEFYINRTVFDVRMGAIYLIYDADDDPNPTGRLGPVDIVNLPVKIESDTEDLEITESSSGAITPEQMLNSNMNNDNNIKEGVILSTKTDTVKVKIDTSNVLNKDIKAYQINTLANQSPIMMNELEIQYAITGDSETNPEIELEKNILEPVSNVTEYNRNDQYVGHLDNEGEEISKDFLDKIRINYKVKKKAIS